jgi:hypothetical protein
MHPSGQAGQRLFRLADRLSRGTVLRRLRTGRFEVPRGVPAHANDFAKHRTSSTSKRMLFSSLACGEWCNPATPRRFPAVVCSLVSELVNGRAWTTIGGQLPTRAHAPTDTDHS